LVLAAENLAATGLGNRQIPLRLLRVLHTHQVEGALRSAEILGPAGFWRGDMLAPIALSDLAAAWPQRETGSVLLRFDTRLRLKAGNGVLKQPPSAEILLQRLLERVSALAQLYGPGALPSEGVRSVLVQARQLALVETTLQWTEWARTSGRTGQTMPWGGLLGEISYCGDLTYVLPWLALGEWLHIGSKTSFGLGHYRLWAAPRCIEF
jgi:hypothetical protein